MISPLRFSAIQLKDVKKGAVIESARGNKSPYRVLDTLATTTKPDGKVTLLLKVEPTKFPPLAMRYTTNLEVSFEQGINNDYNLI